MSVEIRELIIRAVVTGSQKGEANLRDKNESAMEKETIIEECVKQVLKIVKKSGER
jgi:hypothetical protein